MQFLPVKFVSKSLFYMVILLNLTELDESIFQVDVLKLLENAGWNPSFYSISCGSNFKLKILSYNKLCPNLNLVGDIHKSDW